MVNWQYQKINMRKALQELRIGLNFFFRLRFFKISLCLILKRRFFFFRITATHLFAVERILKMHKD